MADIGRYDPLRLHQLLVQLDGAAICLERLGPYLATTSLKPWLRDLARGLLEEVENNLPDPHSFQGIRSAKGKQVRPSQLAGQVSECWELAVLLSMGRAAIRMFLEGWRQPMGFGPKQAD